MSDDLDELTKAEQRGYANAMEAELKLHEDRIEQLERERDEEGINHLAWKLEAEATQANLAKAVEALREIASYDTGATAGLAYTASAVLAELEGEE